MENGKRLFNNTNRKLITDMKKLAIIISAMFAATLFAFDTATVRLTLPNNKIETRKIKLEEVGQGVFRARVPVREIPRETVFLDVIADAAQAQKGEAGWYVLSDGSYIEFTEDNGKYESVRRMALLGFKTPRGAAAAIVKGLDMETVQVAQAKNGKYEVFPRFKIKDIQFDPYEDVIVDFHKLEGDDATYAGVGRAYRNYQLSKGKVRPLAERVKGNKTLKKAAESIYVRIKFSTRVRRGVHHTKWADIPMTVQYTFEEGRQALDRIKKAGMDDVEFCFVGWQKGGHDGPYPDLFPIPEELGGEKGMIETINFGKSIGFQMTTHGNNHDAVKSSARYNKWDVAWDINGNEYKYTMLPGGQVYFTCFQVVNDRWIDEDILGLKKLGLDGVQHVDVVTARIPSPCHNPLHPNNRKQMAEWQRKISQKYIDAFGGYSSECGVDHIADVTDYALYVVWTGGDARNPKFVKKVVPVWQIAYHGIMLSGGPFYSTIDASYPRENEKFSDSNKSYTYLGDTEKRFLKMIEFGGRPSFYYIDYKSKDFSPMKRAYDDYMKRRHLQYFFMEDHKEIAKDVFLTKYSNGEEMVCNYTDKPFEYRGKSVKPMSYELFPRSFWAWLF